MTTPRIDSAVEALEKTYHEIYALNGESKHAESVRRATEVLDKYEKNPTQQSSEVYYIGEIYYLRSEARYLTLYARLNALFEAHTKKINKLEKYLTDAQQKSEKSEAPEEKDTFLNEVEVSEILLFNGLYQIVLDQKSEEAHKNRSTKLTHQFVAASRKKQDLPFKYWLESLKQSQEKIHNFPISHHETILKMIKNDLDKSQKAFSISRNKESENFIKKRKTKMNTFFRKISKLFKLSKNKTTTTTRSNEKPEHVPSQELARAATSPPLLMNSEKETEKQCGKRKNVASVSAGGAGGGAGPEEKSPAVSSKSVSDTHTPRFFPRPPGSSSMSSAADADAAPATPQKKVKLPPAERPSVRSSCVIF